jgi:phosphoglycerate dehydrogenase-like enzyme
MIKAIYFDILNYSEENLALLQKNFELIRLPDPSHLSQNILETASILFAPLGYFFGNEIFSQAPRLKIIATNTTGVPHIDMDAAAAKNIKVISLKDEQEFLRTITPTAELTIGLMISVVRNIVSAREAVLSGSWNRWHFGGTAMLSRMSLGIVGLGRLGSMVAKYASAMGMTIRYYDPFVPHPADSAYKRSEDLASLTGNSDIVSVHIPMNENNRHFFNKTAFQNFKKGTFLINTARGEVIDSDALIEAMGNGIIRGAAIDVLDGEFEPEFEQKVLSHPLVIYAQTHQNLIITPHIAGSTEDAWHLTQQHVIEEVIRNRDAMGQAS